jgi:hypothetical protein
MNRSFHRLWINIGTLLLLLLSAWWSPAAAQGVSTSGVSGIVTTAEGAPVVGAEVIVLYSRTGAEMRALTDETGRYSIGNLRPGGPYLISVSRLGLAVSRRSGVQLQAGEIARLDFELVDEALRLEGLEVTVEIDPVFSVSRTGAMTLLDTAALTKLPTISRNLVDFANVSPMVRVTEDGISVAGQNHQYNAIVIDGAFSQDLFGLSSTGVAGGQANAKLIPLEAVEQYQVQVAPYDVRMSGFTGGLLNFVTKGGTNEWQGSAFSRARDQRFLGDIVIGETSARPGDLRRMVSGFTIGGPLSRDRLHLFVAGETERARQSTSGYSHGIVAPVLTSLAPDSAQRFSEILGQRYGVATGTVEQYRLDNPTDNLFIRLDLLARDNQRLVLRHNLVRAEGDIGANREPVAEYGFSSNGYRQRNLTNTTTLQWYAGIGERYSNEVMLNFHRIRDRMDLASTFPLVDVDIWSSLNGSIFFRRARAGANLFAQAGDLDQDLFQFTNNLTGRFGNHSLTAGLTGEYIQIRQESMVGGLGSYRFASLADLEANQPQFYQRQVFLPSASGSRMDPAIRFSVLRLGAYLQDEWTPAENLMIRAGLRIDNPTFLDTPPENPLFEETFGVSTARLPSGNALLSPRIGFNWSPGEETMTQIRGGIGLFSGTLPLAWVADAFINNGVRSAFLICEGSNAPGFSQEPPTSCLDGTGPSAELPAAVTIFDPELKLPRDFRSSLAVDRALPFGFVGTVEWVFTRALNQVMLREINLQDPVADPRHNAGYTYGFGERAHFGTPTVTGFEPRRRSDDFTHVIEVTNAATNYSYAFGFELQRRFSGKFMLRSGYSFSRSGDTQSLLSSNAIENLGLNPTTAGIAAPRIVPSNYDRPHKVTASATASLPSGWGGAEFTLFYAGQSGKPYSYVYLDDLNGDGYPGLGAALDGTNDPIFVPALFDSIYLGISSKFILEQLKSIDPCIKKHEGSVLPRNQCRAPWSNRLDLRVSQPIDLLGIKADLSGDLINVLNLVSRKWGHLHEVRPTVPILMTAGRTKLEPVIRPVIPEDALTIVYAGPSTIDPETGSAMPALPYTPVFPASQWQAQLGIQLRF